MTASDIILKAIQGYEALGLTPPKAAVTALDEWHRVTTWLHGAPIVENVATMTFEQRIEAIERTALRSAAKVELFRAANDTHEPAICSPGVQAIYADADRTIGKLSDRYNKAAAVVTEALGYYSADDLADTAALFAKGREAAALAYSLSDATAELELICNLVEQLVGTVGQRSARAIAVWINLTDQATDDTIEKALAAFRGTNRWPALFGVLGVTPELHTHDQAAAIVARSTEAKRAAEAAAEAERERLKAEHKAQIQADREKLK